MTIRTATADFKPPVESSRLSHDPAPASNRAEDSVVSLAELMTHYVACAPLHGLRPRTVRDACTVFQHVPAELQAKPLHAITKGEIRRLHGRVRLATSVHQANRLLAVVSRLFSLAEEEDWWVGQNPCRGVKRFQVDQRWRYLSEAEISRLLAACSDYEAERMGAAGGGADAIRLLLLTGARLQEVLQAEWAEFDLDTGYWVKPSAHTKAKRQHRLWLDGPVLEVLGRLRASHSDRRWLFPGRPRAGGAVGPRRDLKRPWNWISKRAGLEGVRLHDLRRTTASVMLSSGATLATVGSALGHTQAATTARYAQLADTVQRSAFRVAGERIWSFRP